MDFSKVGEKFLNSVRSARSLGILPFHSDGPEVPPRAATAAAIARALASLPPHQRLSFPSSEDFVSIYGVIHRDETIEELEEDFYEEDLDPVLHMLEHIPAGETDPSFFENKATLRLAQLDAIAERLSRHVMRHHEQMVKGMQLVMEVEQDLKVANVICMNGRRHIRSSIHEVSRDLVVMSSARKKQALLDMLPVLTQLRHALDMQLTLNTYVENENYVRAFQVFSEYLQVLDSFSDLSCAQEMFSGAEVWLEKTLQRLDSLLLSVCQEFKGSNYMNVVDAYALIGDTGGLVEKIQSFYMQEVFSQTHSVLKDLLHEDLNLQDPHKSRFTYSDLCLQIPESKFRQCLLNILHVLFKIMCSYYAIMSFQLHDKVSEVPSFPGETSHALSATEEFDWPDQQSSASSGSYLTASGEEGHSVVSSSVHSPYGSDSLLCESQRLVCESSDNPSVYSINISSSCDLLRKESIAYITQALQKGRKNLWHLTTSRISVLLSCSSASSSSTHQFLKNYEDLNTFVLSGEAFSEAEATEFRQRLKIVCENYLSSLHRQSTCWTSSTRSDPKQSENLLAIDYVIKHGWEFGCLRYIRLVDPFHKALKMVLDKETWIQISPDTAQMVSLAGLLGDGAPLIVTHDANIPKNLHSQKSDKGDHSGFLHWFKIGNPFEMKHVHSCVDDINSPCQSPGKVFASRTNGIQNGTVALHHDGKNDVKGRASLAEDENEDLLADFIDEDSQLPSRISKPTHVRKHSTKGNGDEAGVITGSSLSLIRLMDKYARLMQKLGVVNTEFFKGMCQLFELYFYVVFETFGQRDAFISGKGHTAALTNQLRTALTRITHELTEQRIKTTSLPVSSLSPVPVNSSLIQMEVTPTCPSITNYVPNTSLGLKKSLSATNYIIFTFELLMSKRQYQDQVRASKSAPRDDMVLRERCNGVESISYIAKLMHRSRVHLQSMLLEKSTTLVDEFYVNVVDAVPDLIEHIHGTTAKLLLSINGYVERIATARWEVKDLGLEHNGYVDLLLGEFKHYKTRLMHGGIQKEFQDLLLEYGLDNVSEILIEGLSRVKRCTNEGRALMALDLQVLMNGMQHLVSVNVKPKLQPVEAFIKAYYLPETEYVHWARSHPEYSKTQVTGLVNLVAAMNNWKRKTRLDVLEKIETGCL